MKVDRRTEPRHLREMAQNLDFLVTISLANGDILQGGLGGYPGPDRSTNPTEWRGCPRQDDMKSYPSSLPSVAARRACVLLFPAIALAFLYLRTFLLPWTPLAPRDDQVLFFQHANRILQGQVPFRDFFVIVMPGTDLLYAAAFKLLGVHLWLAQTFVIVLGFSIACLVLWISFKVLSGPSILLPGILFLVLDFNHALDATHHWYSTLLVMGAAAMLLDRTSVGRIMTAGALCGIATIFTQTGGALSLIAIAVYLFWIVRDKKAEISLITQLASLVLPFIVIVGSFLAYYSYQAGVSTLFYALWYFAYKFILTAPYYRFGAYFLQVPQHQTPGDLVRMIPFVFIYALVPFAYPFCLLRLFRQKNNMDPGLWRGLLLLSFVGIALFAAVMTGPTYHRLSMVAPPAIILCVWFFSGTTIVDRVARGLLWAIAIALVLYFPVRRQLQWKAYLNLPTGRAAFIDPKRYELVKWFAGHTYAGENFFTEPQISFALALNNPTRLDCVTPDEFTRPEQVDSLIRALDAHSTPLIFLYPELYTLPQHGDNLGPFRQYVYTNYHLVKTSPAGQVWERTQEVAPSFLTRSGGQ